jgi:hypothetical protein
LILLKSPGQKRTRRKKIKNKLSELEERAAQKGVHIHYDLLEAAGLKLNGGICKINGEYHIFIDRRKSTSDKIDILQNCLNHVSPEDNISSQRSEVLGSH